MSGVEVLTSLEVCDLVREVGRRGAGGDWPTTSVSAKTTEGSSVLGELLREIGNQSASPVLSSEPMTQADLIALARINETIKRLQSLLWQVFDSAEIRPYTRKSRTNPKWLNPDYYGLAVQADVAARRRRAGSRITMSDGRGAPQSRRALNTTVPRCPRSESGPTA